MKEETQQMPTERAHGYRVMHVFLCLWKWLTTRFPFGLISRLAFLRCSYLPILNEIPFCLGVEVCGEMCRVPCKPLPCLQPGGWLFHGILLEFEAKKKYPSSN